MKISFIGYGAMADSLSSNWADKHELFIGGRNDAKAKKLAASLTGSATHGTTEDAIGFGEIVVLAVGNDAVEEILEKTEPQSFAGKTLIDIVNPVNYKTFLPKKEFLPSLGEYLQQRLPDAHVVKAFNMSQAQVWKMDDPTFDGRQLVAMFCGNDEGAKKQVAQLISETGAEPLDLGGIEKSRLLEPAAAIVIQMLFSGRDKRTLLNLIQPEVKEP